MEKRSSVLSPVTVPPLAGAGHPPRGAMLGPEAGCSIGAFFERQFMNPSEVSIRLALFACAPFGLVRLVVQQHMKRCLGSAAHQVYGLMGGRHGAPDGWKAIES